MNVLERFLKYVVVHTTSDENTGMTPSTPQQFEFAKMLGEELKSIGLEDVNLDKNGYLMATLPSNLDYDVPTVGFIAHLDTSPDMSGKNVKPRVVENYDGKDIVLNEKENIILSPDQFPELKNHLGHSLVVTNGLTLLGADDKAGIAEIITAMEYFIENKDVKHGKVRIAFTPDEEIGLGAAKFDVNYFGADFAYTMDGGEIGELEYENFNAAAAKIIFNGINVHPGYAKNKMVNAIKMAMEFLSMLPSDEAPETTSGREGFFHATSIDGDVEKAVVSVIIRDHDRQIFEKRKQFIVDKVEKLNQKFGEGSAVAELRDQYYNMKEKIEPVMHIIDIASKAFDMAGVTPKIKPIRGGTDGSQLSFKGLPCPNIFAGGYNFHGKYEFVPKESMEKATEVVKNIVKIIAEKR